MKYTLTAMSKIRSTHNSTIVRKLNKFYKFYNEVLYTWDFPCVRRASDKTKLLKPCGTNFTEYIVGKNLKHNFWFFLAIPSFDQCIAMVPQGNHSQPQWNFQLLQFFPPNPPPRFVVYHVADAIFLFSKYRIVSPFHIASIWGKSAT